MDSFTITCSGKEQVLESVFFPPIELKGKYEIGLIDFFGYNSIHNIVEPHNKLYYYDPQILLLKPGVHTIAAFNAQVKELGLSIKDKQREQSNKNILFFNNNVWMRLAQITAGTIEIRQGEGLHYMDKTKVKTIEIPSGTYEIADIKGIC